MTFSSLGPTLDSVAAAHRDLGMTPVNDLAPQERRLFDSMVIHEDRDIFVLNKPSGFAVQGGSKTHHHLDGLRPTNHCAAMNGLNHICGICPEIIR